MTLEELVAPLWFAKKLPTDMDSVAVWIDFTDSIDVYLRENTGKVSNVLNSYPAPTMQEMLPLVEKSIKHPGQAKPLLVEAFNHELRYNTGGWQYLDKLLFEK